MNVSFDFSGANVLVTGGTSGIGLGVARAFASSGASVKVTGRRAGADSYQHDLSAFDYHRAEMSDSGSVDELVASLDRLDVLVNNAGATFPGGRDEWDPDVFAEALAVNLVGAMRLSTACRSLLAGGGSVVNVVSLSAFRAVPIVPGYGSAKAGLDQLTRNLAMAWADDGIRVNAVAPGNIETPMTAPIHDLPELEAAQVAHTPMGRFGAVAEVAPVVLFLASDAASYMTGATVVVDGGYLLV